MGQLLGDFWLWLEGLANICLNVVFILYQLLDRVLPGIIMYRGTHAWWHNLLVVVGWIALYIFLSRKYYSLARGVKEFLSDGVEDAYGFTLFPWWHWLFYGAAAATLPLVNYYAWPSQARLMMIPLIAVPLLYLLVKGGAAMPVLVLRQLIILALSLLGFLIFMPIAVLALVVAGLLFMFSGVSSVIFQSARESGRMRCPHCGTWMIRGTSCKGCGTYYG